MNNNSGRLRSIGRHKLGLATCEYFRCDDCGSDFPVIDGEVKCNGHPITACPWCCSPGEQSARAAMVVRA